MTPEGRSKKAWLALFATILPNHSPPLFCYAYKKEKICWQKCRPWHVFSVLHSSTPCEAWLERVAISLGRQAYGSWKLASILTVQLMPSNSCHRNLSRTRGIIRNACISRKVCARRFRVQTAIWSPTLLILLNRFLRDEEMIKSILLRVQTLINVIRSQNDAITNEYIYMLSF